MLSYLALVAFGAFPQDPEPAQEDRAALRADIDRHEAELEEMRVRLDGLGGNGGAAESDLEKALRGVLGGLRLGVRGDVIVRQDDRSEFDEDGNSVDDRVVVRRVDFDVLAPLGGYEDVFTAEVFVVAGFDGDPSGELEGDADQAFVRIKWFEETSHFPITTTAGKLRVPFGRNNRWRVYEMPQATRPRVVEWYLGEDGFTQNGGTIEVGIPTGSETNDVDVTFGLLNSEGIEFTDNESEQLAATLLNVNWRSELTEELTLLAGFSYYRSKDVNDPKIDGGLGGVDLLLNWFRPEAGFGRRMQLGGEAMEAEIVDQSGGDPFGAYLWGEVEVAHDWFLGSRYDYVEDARNARVDYEQIGFHARYFLTEHLHFAAGWEHLWSDNDAADSGDHVFARMAFSFGAEDLLEMWTAGESL